VEEALPEVHGTTLLSQVAEYQKTRLMIFCKVLVDRDHAACSHAAKFGSFSGKL
jgi:hypothetical protein